MLKKFDFYLEIYLKHRNNIPSLQSIITSFRSSFWLNNKHWFVKYDFGKQTRSDSYRIRLYTTSFKIVPFVGIVKCEISSINPQYRLIRLSMKNEIVSMDFL